MFSDEKMCFETVVSDHIRNTFIKNNDSVERKCRFSSDY